MAAPTGPIGPTEPRPRFSRRVPWHLPHNPLSQAVAARRQAGLPLIDLTVSNPTSALPELYEPSLLLPLSDARGLRYEPSPQGLPAAREAIGSYYARRGLAVDPRHTVLSASTSEAYAWLFQLLCEPGERVLFPVPSYPLIELLAGVCGVQVDPYALYYDGRWRLDTAALDQALTETTRALVLVNPNNPTGAFLHRDELGPLVALCAARGVALIVDEVFGDYPLEAATAGEDAAVGSLLELAAPEALVFVLSGLSKVVGLPQLKLGWIVTCGPEPLRSQAQDRLEILADTFLSVGTPVQLAAPSLLAQAERLRAAISLRTRTNLESLRAAVAGSACQVLPVEGGWYAVLRLPRVLSEEQWVLAFLDAGVLCQPGYFFDFPEEAYAVVSLLCRPEPFALGITRILERVQHELAP